MTRSRAQAMGLNHRGKISVAAATPAAKAANARICPTRAITFGNLKDEQSAVVKFAHSPRAYHVLEEIGTRPSITYLQKVVREHA